MTDTRDVVQDESPSWREVLSDRIGMRAAGVLRDPSWENERLLRQAKEALAAYDADLEAK